MIENHFQLGKHRPLQVDMEKPGSTGTMRNIETRRPAKGYVRQSESGANLALGRFDISMQNFD